MRFLHAADLHIDSPLRGLDRYEGAPVDDVRGATRQAFENLIATALRERVDLVVIGGDLYDKTVTKYQRAKATGKLTPFEPKLLLALEADSHRPKRDQRTVRCNTEGRLHRQLYHRH